MDQRGRQVKVNSFGWVRITWFITGVLWFVWLGIEDSSTVTVLLISAALCFAMTTTNYQHHVKHITRSRTRRFLATLLVGLLGGLLVAPTAVVLMAVKTSLHNHIVPDFTQKDVIQVLHSTPAWVLGALILAAACDLYNRLTE
jgi:hypothetical protein